jgi:hypothetical protein
MESSLKRRAVVVESPLPAWSCSGGKHFLRVFETPSSSVEIESSSVDVVGSQGLHLVFVSRTAISVPVSRMEVFFVDAETGQQRILLAGEMARRRHDGGEREYWTCEKGQIKLVPLGDQNQVLQFCCTLHGLAHASLGTPQPQHVAPQHRFEGWSLLVALRVESSLLYERRLSLSVAEISSEVLQIVCLSPPDFVAESITRPVLAGDSDRLKLACDWTLWAPSSVLVCHQSCYLWTQRNRQFPTVYLSFCFVGSFVFFFYVSVCSSYEAVSLNREGFGIRFTIQDRSQTEKSLLVAMSVDLSLSKFRKWLASTSLTLKDVAVWLAGSS